jgi:ferredoxin
MKIAVNRVLCCGHARCNATAPTLFHLTDDGYIDTDGFDVKPGDEALARKGARACPERAIRVVDEPGDPPKENPR